MTFLEIMEKTSDIKMEYEYRPMKESKARPASPMRRERNVCEDGSCASNVIGMDDGTFLGVKCCEAK